MLLEGGGVKILINGGKIIFIVKFIIYYFLGFMSFLIISVYYYLERN